MAQFAVALARADPRASEFQGGRPGGGAALLRAASLGAYVVVVISIGRARRMASNFVITGVAALLNVVLNLVLIPPYGIRGAAFATLSAYVAMFAGMAWKAQRVFPVPYQWRRGPRRGGGGRAHRDGQGARREPARGSSCGPCTRSCSRCWASCRLAERARIRRGPGLRALAQP